MSFSKYCFPGMVCKLFFILFLFNALSSSANPFLGSGDADETPAAIVRGQTIPALVSAQLSIRDRITETFTNLRENPAPGALGIFFLGSFLYGLIHAAGPGHRKSIVFSLFLTKKTAPWEPLAVGLLSTGLHGAMGIAVLGVLSLIKGAISGLGAVDSAFRYLEGYSFLGLAVISLTLMVRQIVHLVLHRGHSHDSGSGGTNNIYAVVALTSLVPCPGTTMLLMLAVFLDMVTMGLLGVLAMALGMAVVVSTAGYLAYFGRQNLFRQLRNREGAMGLVSEGLELAAYLFMTLFALYTAWPFLSSLVGLA